MITARSLLNGTGRRQHQAILTKCSAGCSGAAPTPPCSMSVRAGYRARRDRRNSYRRLVLGGELLRVFGHPVEEERARRALIDLSHSGARKVRNAGSVQRLDEAAREQRAAAPAKRRTVIRATKNARRDGHASSQPAGEIYANVRRCAACLTSGTIGSAVASAHTTMRSLKSLRISACAASSMRLHISPGSASRS